MSTLTLDPIGFSKALQKAGMPEAQADLIARTQQDAIEQVIQSRDLATKGDLREMELRIDARLNDLKVSLIKWFVGSILSLAAFLTAVFFGMFAVMVR